MEDFVCVRVEVNDVMMPHIILAFEGAEIYNLIP